jgi:hypothetical protein
MLVGDAARVDGDEGPVAARRGGVEDAREDLLAGAVLAGDEDAGVRRRDALDEGHHLLHGARARDDGGELGLAGARGLGVEPVDRAQRVAQLELGVEGGEQARVVPRLLDVVARAAANGLDRALDAAPCGHDDDGEGGVELAQAREEVHALAARGGVARVVEIEQADVEVLGLAQGEDGGGGGRRAHVEAVGAGEHAHRLEDIGLVIGDQEPRLGHTVAYWPRRSSTTRPSNRWTTRVALRA